MVYGEVFLKYDFRMLSPPFYPTPLIPSNRNLAILRTGRQIHSEATHLLRSKLILSVWNDEIRQLRYTEEAVPGFPPEPIPWRHNSLHGLGRSLRTSKHVYQTPELEGALD